MAKIKTNIKHIQIGEIITIGEKNREWIIAETTHNNGKTEWQQPTLIQLEHLLDKKINKNIYYQRNKIFADPLPTKRIKGRKLTNIRRVKTK